MKNIFKVLMITIILLVIHSVELQAAEIVDSGTCGQNITWKLDDKGTLVISGEGEMYNYVQVDPSDRVSPFCRDDIKKIVIEGNITRIGSAAFFRCTSVTEVIIPSSVTEIADCAFFQCNNLRKINIPSSVTRIGIGAFSDCTSLTEIEIPLGVTEIAVEAFMGCTSLTKVEIPSSVTRIKYGTFIDCTSLTKINIPSSVTEIGAATFRGCTSLTEVEIPSSVTDIGCEAFRGCTSLTKVEIPSSVTRIVNGTFRYCTSLTEVEIPSSVTEIEYEAFWGCTSLTEVEIPSSVTWISEDVFSHSAIRCEKGSYAETYAKENNVVCHTVSGNIGAATEKSEVTLDAAKTNNPKTSNPNHVLSKAIYSEGYVVKPLVQNTNLVKQYKTITLDFVLNIVNSKKITIDCAVIGDADTVKEYVLYKGDKRLATSNTGVITVNLNGNCIGQDFYVEVVSTKGERTKTQLQLNVKSRLEPKSTELKIGGGSIIELKIPNDVPFFGGATFELDSALLPVYAMQTDEGAIRVGINLKKDMLEDDSKFYDFEKEFGELCKDIRKGNVYSKQKLKNLKKVLNNPVLKWKFGPNDVDLIISGYGEGKVDEETGELIATVDFLVSVSGSHTWAKQMFLFQLPIVVKADVGFEGEFEEELVMEWGKEGISFKEGDIVLDLSGKISVFGGAGIKFIAAVGAFGSGELSGEYVWFSSNRELGPDNVDLILEAGLKGYVGPWEGEIVIANKTWNIYSRPKPQTFSLHTISDIAESEIYGASMYDESTYLLSDDSYCAVFTAGEGTMGSVISDAFISAQPVVAATDDFVVMTYLTMDSLRPTADSTVLMYMVYDKAQGTWTEPKKVDSDDTMDWTSLLYSDGENIRLAYVQQDNKLSEDVSINDLTLGMKITTAVFSPEEMEFIDFEDVAKSNETDYVSRPVIGEIDNTSVIYWVQGPSGDYFGANSENSIYYSSLTDEGWSEAVMLADDLNCITEISVGGISSENVVAYITDEDNNLDTYDDRVITVIKEGEKTIVASGEVGNVLFDVLPGRTESSMLWYEDGNIGILSDVNGENEYLFAKGDEGVLANSVESDFRIIGDKILFSKTDMSGNSAIYSINYENGVYSAPIPVVSATETITSFSADDEMVVWVDTQAIIQDGGIDDYSVIGYCLYNEQYDIEALYAQFEQESLEPKKEISVNIGIQNNTDSELSSVDVVILDEDGNIFSETTAECSISSGDVGEATVVFTAPAFFEGANYRVLVTGQKNDTVPDNNSTELNFDLTELSLKVKETIYEEKGYFVVDVTNESYVSTGGTVTLSDKDGNVLYTEVIADITGKGTYSVVIEAEELLGQAEKKIIIAKVEADKDEYNTVNNEVIENVVLLSGEIPYVTIVFKNGEEEIKNSIYPVGATIVPEELPDGAIGWYKLGDESKTIVTEFNNISTDMIYVAKMEVEDKLNNALFKHNCSFGNNFTLVYAIKKSDLEGFDNIRLSVEKNEYEGDMLIGTSTRVLEWTSYTIGEDDYYRFDYDDIQSCEIGDEVRATLIAEIEGVEYQRTVDVYNLKDYAYNRLAASTVSEFKTLLVDMLNYCAESQEYFNYRKDSKANSELTEEQKALSSGSYATLNNNESITVLEGKTVPKILKNVSFGNRIEAVFAMDLSNYSDLSGITLRVGYTNLQGVEKVLNIDSSTFKYDSSIGMYYGKVSSLSAAELRKVMTVTVMYNGVPVSDTITYSIETYVNKKLASSTDEVFKTLLEDMMIYADSAQAYFQ